jgi:cell fate regulator YaaT (PSP1 superfamily)
MKVYAVKFISWDQDYYHKTTEEAEYNIGDYVVTKTTSGYDLGRIENFYKGDLVELEKNEEIHLIYRKVEKKDLEEMEKNNKYNKDCLKYCCQLIKKHKLEMKLVDVHISMDGNKVTFAFIADGRVDFRELVKDLVKKYNKSIRLQQLGVRDEVKYFGDIGSCGRVLCCQKHLQELGNVTSDFAKNQHVANRGSDRLSGVCGRLKCCLAYEEKMYEEFNKKFPPMGSKYKAKEGEGIVVGYHTLKGTIDLKISAESGENIIEVKI